MDDGMLCGKGFYQHVGMGGRRGKGQLPPTGQGHQRSKTPEELLIAPLSLMTYKGTRICRAGEPGGHNEVSARALSTENYDPGFHIGERTMAGNTEAASAGSDARGQGGRTWQTTQMM